MLFFSIIVPVYNVETYLKRCLDNLKNQTYNNFEVLLIDDGSTDKSGLICDEYSSRDKRFKVYHKENEGVSSARNLGISEASGDYITFVDSDDWIDITYLSFVTELLEEANPDLLVNSFNRADDKSIKYIDLSSKNRKHFSGYEALYEMCVGNYFGWEPVARFYKTNKLNNVRFDEKIKYGEDLLFNYIFLKQKNITIIYEPVAKYNYYYRITSAVNSYTLTQKWDDIKVIQFIIDNEKNYIGEFFLRNCLWPRLVNRCKDALFSMKKEDLNHAIFLSKILRPYFWKILLGRNTSLKMRIKTAIISPFFFFGGKQ